MARGKTKQYADIAELRRDLSSEFTMFCVDADKLMRKGNRAAGIRSRACSLKIAEMLKQWRKLSVCAA